MKIECPQCGDVFSWDFCATDRYWCECGAILEWKIELIGDWNKESVGYWSKEDGDET